MASKLLLPVFLLLFLGLKNINAQFLEQPDAGTMFVPVNDRVTLSCSVDVGYSVDWEVRFGDGVRITAARSINAPIFARRNITINGLLTTRSTLSFTYLEEVENKTNNITTIMCIAQLQLTSQDSGNEVQVIFYDAPPPPNLNFTEDELGSLNISWTLGFIEGVPVNYTLTALNVNVTNAKPVIIAGLLDQHYVFETSRPCDMYSFTVTAVTAAGNSTPSQEIIFTRDSSSFVCLATTKSAKTDATTFNRNAGLSDGAVAGIVVSVLGAAIIGGICAVIVIILLCMYKRAKDLTTHPDPGVPLVETGDISVISTTEAASNAIPGSVLPNNEPHTEVKENEHETHPNERDSADSTCETHPKVGKRDSANSTIDSRYSGKHVAEASTDDSLATTDPLLNAVSGHLSCDQHAPASLHDQGRQDGRNEKLQQPQSQGRQFQADTVPKCPAHDQHASAPHHDQKKPDERIQHPESQQVDTVPKHSSHDQHAPSSQHDQDGCSKEVTRTLDLLNGPGLIQGATATGRTGYIYQFSSHMLVHPFGGSTNPDDGTNLVLHTSRKNPERLQMRFVQKGSGEFGYIEHVSSGKVVCPEVGSKDPPDDTPLVLHNDKSDRALFKFEEKKIIHISGKRWHPKGGNILPSNDTFCVLHSHKHAAAKFFFGDIEGKATSVYP